MRAINTCTSYDFDRVFQEFTEMGVTLLYILKLDVTAGEEYHLNLTTAVQRLIADDIDLVIIHDFKILCMDFIPEAKSVDWTPRALYLNLCGQDVTAMAELGTDVCDLTVKLKCIAGLLESMSYSSVNAISCRVCNIRHIIPLGMQLGPRIRFILQIFLATRFHISEKYSKMNFSTHRRIRPQLHLRAWRSSPQLLKRKQL
jgi:hypothetical protein